MEYENNLHKVPNIAAYHDGKFHWGYELADELVSNTIPESKVIRLMKLAIFNDSLTVDIKSRIQKKLDEANKTVEELIEDMLRAVISHCREYLRRDHPIRLTYDIDRIPQELFLSVPQSKLTAQRLRGEF